MYAANLLSAASLAKKAGDLGRYNAAMRVYNGLAISNTILAKSAAAPTLLWSAAKALLAGNTLRASVP